MLRGARIENTYTNAAAVAPTIRNVVAVNATWMPWRSATAPVTSAPPLPMPNPTPIIRLDATPTNAGSSRCASAVTCASEAKNSTPATNTHGTSTGPGSQGTGSRPAMPVPWLPGPVLVPWVFVAGVLFFASEAQVTALAQRLLPAFVGVASSLMMGVGLGIGNGGALVTGAVADRQGIQFALTATTFLMVGAIAAALVYVFSMRAPRSIGVLEA